MNTVSDHPSKSLLNKVPEVTLFFWIIKMMSITVGETAADFLIFNLHLGLTLTSIGMGVLLLVMLFVQLKSKTYVPWIYWLTVVLISIFGTLITDNLVDNLGVSLEVTTTFFSVALITTFICWYASERTLSIHTINTRKRELFYWAAILFTFALGTAAGDLVAEGLQLGYLNSALMFGLIIGSIAMLYYAFKRHAITAFWTAYILTRPFGASWGDYLSQPMTSGGLGLGTIDTSILFLVVILILVAYLSIRNKQTRPL